MKMWRKRYSVTLLVIMQISASIIECSIETLSSIEHRAIVWPSYLIPGYISGSGVTIQKKHEWPCVYCDTIHNNPDVELP